MLDINFNGFVDCFYHRLIDLNIISVYAKRWMERYAINWFKSPPESPDMNPIEVGLNNIIWYNIWHYTGLIVIIAYFQIYQQAIIFIFRTSGTSWRSTWGGTWSLQTKKNLWLASRNSGSLWWLQPFAGTTSGIWRRCGPKWKQPRVVQQDFRKPIQLFD